MLISIIIIALIITTIVGDVIISGAESISGRVIRMTGEMAKNALLAKSRDADKRFNLSGLLI